MLGHFLELSVQADEILDSIGFYEALGFRQLPVGETWQHPYAVLSDGTLQIGLHQYEFESPALTFVRPDLAEHAPTLRERGADFAFAKLDPDEFNELGFVEPGGQMVALLEARTFSPPSFGDEIESALGKFHCYGLRSNDIEMTVEFWQRLGFEMREQGDALTLLSGSGLTIGVGAKNAPILSFEGDIEAFAEHAARRGLTEARISGDGKRGSIVTPEGLTLVVNSPS